MKKLLLTSILIIAAVSISSAQLSGPLSGTLGPGTFTVVGDITVPSGETLTIMPGTELLHAGSFQWSIMGQLIAEGTETDSIIFKRLNENNFCRWRGLRFQQGATGASYLDYCIMEYTYHVSSPLNVDGGAIRALGTDLTVTNCRISNCQAFYDGGGIFAREANIIIDNCLIVDNLADEGGNGGGINLENCTSAVITNNTIAFNRTTGT